MTVRNLGALFEPDSVAEFAGPPLPLAKSPALALLHSAPGDWAEWVAQLGAAGTRAVVLQDAAVGPATNAEPAWLAACTAARPFLLRLLGPGPVALLNPRHALRAGLDHCPAAISAVAGSCAWVCADDVTARAALEFAAPRNIGVSLLVALGQQADVDCADVLDYLASDVHTKVVLLVVSRVRSARKFMSAVRACVRNKPVLVCCELQSGEDPLAYQAAWSRAAVLPVRDRAALLAQWAALSGPPEAAADLWADWRRLRETLAQTPPSLPPHHLEAQQALGWIARLRSASPQAGRFTLSAEQAQRLFGYFDLRIVDAPHQDERHAEGGVASGHPLAFNVTLRDDVAFGPWLKLATADLAPAGTLLPLNANLATLVLQPFAGALVAYPQIVPWFVDALVGLSQLLCHIEAVVGFSARLRAANGLVSFDRVSVQIGVADRRRPLAIRPYPVALERHMDCAGQAMTIRPIRPDDEAAHADFFRAMTPDDLRLRFFNAVRQPEHSQLARYVQIDYDREMALIACTENAGVTVIHGVVRAITDPDNETAEFAVTVRSDEQGHHLGRCLMERIIDYCRSRGTRAMVGSILHENTAMLALARNCGFTQLASDDATIVAVRLELNP